MSYETDREYIEGRFDTNWTSASTPIAFDNVNGLKQNTTWLDSERGLDEWCRITILPAGTIQTSPGVVKTIRRTGVIIVNIFTNENIGSNRARELCDAVVTIFQFAMFNGIQCRECEVSREGQNDGLFQMTVSTSYFVHE